MANHYKFDYRFDRNLSNRSQKFNQIGLGCLAAIAFSLIAIIPAANAQLFDGPVDKLPPIERDSLRKGRVVVNGSEGKYIAKVLVTATPDLAWSVIADYDHLAEFVPSLSSSKVLEDDGDRKVIEQVGSQQIFIINVSARNKLEIKETDKRRIDFNLIEGDAVESMVGFWQLEEVSEYPGAPPTQVLITHSVDVKPSASTPEGIFYEVLKGSLSETLAAIADEVDRRSQ